MANRIMLNQTSYHGAGAISELPTEVKSRGLKKALICCGPTLLRHGVIAGVTDVMDAAGATAVGVVSGLLVCFGVWFLDNVLKVDDPVGAVAVHMLNGIWGTLAVGLFATTTAPDCELTGLFYGGGFDLLGKQAFLSDGCLMA